MIQEIKTRKTERMSKIHLPQIKEFVSLSLHQIPQIIVYVSLSLYKPLPLIPICFPSLKAPIDQPAQRDKKEQKE